MASLGPRKFRRGVFRGYVEELKRTGIFETARARGSPDLVAVLDHPHRRGRRRAGRQERGARAGYNVIEHSFATVMEPIIHTALRVIGGGPASLFSRAHAMLAVTTQGIEMNWVPTGPTSGTMRIRCDEVMPELGCISWEGTLVYGLELANAQGTVAEGRRSADGKSCEIDVSWTRTAS